MGKRNKAKASRQTDGPQPTRYERIRIAQARQAGCWLLIRGTSAERQWVLFHKTTGKQLGWYSPPSGRYGYGSGRVAGSEANGANALGLLIDHANGKTAAGREVLGAVNK